MTNMTDKKFEKVYSLDTNIILDNATNFLTLSDEGKNLIVLPETVLDEIDSKKSGFDEINFQARSFARLLFDAQIKDKKEYKTKYDGVTLTIVETAVQGCTIYIISKNIYKADTDKVPGSIKNDRKILEITQDLQEIEGYKDIKFISLDVMARTRAVSLGIPTEAMNLGSRDEILEFIKEVKTEKVIVDGDDILDYDEDYKPNNFNYLFDDGVQKKLACVQNGRIKLLDEKELRKQNVNPMNKEQLFFSNALLDNHYDIIVAEAKAGSGKTLLAISAAMELIKRKDFQRIVYIRNSVESLAKGEDVGYLSGNDEKFEIYNFPLFDTLAYIASKMIARSNENKQGKGKLDSQPTEELISEKVEQLVERFQVQTMWTGALRGRTISDAIVIIDEAQNMANSTMQLTLSRVDSSCKIIVLGSNRQIDNAYITKHTNGLTTLLNATKDSHEEVNLFGVELHKVLRGPITAFAEKVFEK